MGIKKVLGCVADDVAEGIGLGTRIPADFFNEAFKGPLGCVVMLVTGLIISSILTLIYVDIKDKTQEVADSYYAVGIEESRLTGFNDDEKNPLSQKCFDQLNGDYDEIRNMPFKSDYYEYDTVQGVSNAIKRDEHGNIELRYIEGMNTSTEWNEGKIRIHHFMDKEGKISFRIRGTPSWRQYYEYIVEDYRNGVWHLIDETGHSFTLRLMTIDNQSVLVFIELEYPGKMADVYLFDKRLTKEEYK